MDVVDEIVRAHRALAAAGQSDLVWGHAGLRDPDGRGVWMKAAGYGLEEIGRQQVVLVSPEGEVLDGPGERHIEFHIHAQVMATRPDVRAVVHSHVAAAVAFAALDVPLRPLSHDAVPFQVPGADGVADIVRFTATGDLIRTAELGADLATVLGSANGCLIPGHGLVTVGVDVAAAVMHAALLDRACRIALDAAAAGGPRRWSSDVEVASKRAGVWSGSQLHAGYDYLVRRADDLFGPV